MYSGGKTKFCGQEFPSPPRHSGDHPLTPFRMPPPSLRSSEKGFVDRGGSHKGVFPSRIFVPLLCLFSPVSPCHSGDSFSYILGLDRRHTSPANPFFFRTSDSPNHCEPPPPPCILQPSAGGGFAPAVFHRAHA